MSDKKRGWYVLRAISGKEAKVKEYLDAEIKNTDLGDFVYQVLIPTEKVYSVRNGKKITKERNLYPGYVLVEATLVGEVAIGCVIRPMLSDFWAVRRSRSVETIGSKSYAGCS